MEKVQKKGFLLRKINEENKKGDDLKNVHLCESLRLALIKLYREVYFYTSLYLRNLLRFVIIRVEGNGVSSRIYIICPFIFHFKL